MNEPYPNIEELINEHGISKYNFNGTVLSNIYRIDDYTVFVYPHKDHEEWKLTNGSLLSWEIERKDIEMIKKKLIVSILKDG